MWILGTIWRAPWPMYLFTSLSAPIFLDSLHARMGTSMPMYSWQLKECQSNLLLFEFSMPWGEPKGGIVWEEVIFHVHCSAWVSPLSGALLCLFRAPRCSFTPKTGLEIYQTKMWMADTDLNYHLLLRDQGLACSACLLKELRELYRWVRGRGSILALSISCITLDQLVKLSLSGYHYSLNDLFAMWGSLRVRCKSRIWKMTCLLEDVE